MHDYHLQLIRQGKKNYELIEFLEDHFGRPPQFDIDLNGNIKSLVYSKPDHPYFLVADLDKNGIVSKIDLQHGIPGQKISNIEVAVYGTLLEQEASNIEAAIHDALLVDCGYHVGQTICFFDGTVERYFTCQYFQILPVPAYASKPKGLKNYPFLFQYLYPASSNPSIDAMRRQETKARYLNLLNLLIMNTHLKYNPGAFHQGWTFTEQHKAEERFIGYLYEGLSNVIPSFSDTAHYQATHLEPNQAYYYNMLGLNVINLGDTELKLPDNLAASFEKAHSLSNDDQEKLYRACYWLHQSQEAWSTSLSASLIALVTAIESVAGKSREKHPVCGHDLMVDEESCNECGSPLYRSTKTFKEFVEAYCSVAVNYPKAAGLLYTTRSSLVHGADILLHDSHPWIDFTKNKKAWEQRSDYTQAYLITKNALYNWLQTCGPNSQ
jgi:hypothetical protein